MANGSRMTGVTAHGRRREMGLGALRDLTLADARQVAARWRAVAASGRDPKKERERKSRGSLADGSVARGDRGRAFRGSEVDLSHDYRLPEGLLRTSSHLTHPIFHMNRAEAEMTRYMRRLADRDLALDRAMIPLGSCTMKLNATAKMMALSWPEFSDVHPFAPDSQTAGYAEMLRDLEANRVDNVYGDRHLICSCPPLESYLEAAE